MDDEKKDRDFATPDGPVIELTVSRTPEGHLQHTYRRVDKSERPHVPLILPPPSRTGRLAAYGPMPRARIARVSYRRDPWWLVVGNALAICAIVLACIVVWAIFFHWALGI